MTLSQIDNLPNDDLKIWRLCREADTLDGLLNSLSYFRIPVVRFEGILAYKREDGKHIPVAPDANMCHPNMVTPIEV